MKEYMQMFIWMMLFVIVIEMIFPDSDYRKYIKLILGCILVYTLLKPVVGLINVEGKNYDAYVAAYQLKLGGLSTGGEADYEAEVEKGQESLKAIYKESMKSLVETKLEVSVKTLDIEWQETEGEEEITAIYMTVGEGESGSDWSISPIQIGDKSNTVGGDHENLKNKIKTCLNNFYNVQVRNIHITVQKK